MFGQPTLACFFESGLLVAGIATQATVPYLLRVQTLGIAPCTIRFCFILNVSVKSMDTRRPQNRSSGICFPPGLAALAESAIIFQCERLDFVRRATVGLLTTHALQPNLATAHAAQRVWPAGKSAGARD